MTVSAIRVGMRQEEGRSGGDGNYLRLIPGCVNRTELIDRRVQDDGR